MGKIRGCRYQMAALRQGLFNGIGSEFRLRDYHDMAHKFKEEVEESFVVSVF